MTHIHEIIQDRICNYCWSIDQSDIPNWFSQVFQWMINGRISAEEYLTAKMWLITSGIIKAISTI